MNPASEENMSCRAAFPHALASLYYNVSSPLVRQMRRFLFLLFFLCAATFASAAEVASVPREVRAVWLTTISGLDWPSRPATDAASAKRQQRELCRMLDQLQTIGINVVLFQTRLRATTAYPSALEPYDGVFAGAPGRTPPYDPLRFALDECHKRGMELHAWVVAFPIGKDGAMKRLGNRGLAKMRPELCRRAGEEWYMNPALPATADYLAKLCREIVENYEVDGIHLDYIRYPEHTIPFRDDADFRRLAPAGLSKSAWRKQNVDRCVKAVADAVKGVRPWVKLSCSPVGKYADLPRASSFGWNARDAVSQDAQAWLAKGWMDWLFPMMYFDGRHFYPFLADWKENEGPGRVIPGLGIYFLSPSEKNWNLHVVTRQMSVSRMMGLGGHAFFRTRFLLNDVKGLFSWLRTDFYARPALVPPISPVASDTSAAPAAPELRVEREGKTLHFSWNAITATTPVHYRLYRLDAGRDAVVVADHLTDTSFSLTPALPSLLHSTYVLTAVDAYGRESL